MTSDKKEDRANVASLIRFVLIGELCVREAILKFPRDREEQDDYLEMIANTLEKGDNLPQNIIANYNKYYKATSIPHTDNKRGILKSFLRYLNIS